MAELKKVIERLEIQLEDLQKYADSDEILTLTQEQAKEIVVMLKEQENELTYLRRDCRELRELISLKD